MLPLGISSSDCLGHGFEPILTLQAMLPPGLSPKPAGAVTVALKVGTCVSVGVFVPYWAPVSHWLVLGACNGAHATFNDGNTRAHRFCTANAKSFNSQ